MIRMLNFAAAGLTILLAGGACAADEVFPVVHNEPITLRVLDGKAGKPQPHVHVILVAGYDRHDLDLELWREEAATDAAGEVHLSDALRNLPFLRVEVLKHRACATSAGDAAASVERIRRDGLSATNRCGALAMENAPGVFTVFVKAGKTAKPENPSKVLVAAKP